MGFCSSDAPDYSSVANASKEAAELSYKLGQEQLAFSKSQYEAMKPLYSSLVSSQQSTAAAQNAIAAQAAAQGQDYFDYQKSFRPVEQQMLKESMAGNEARTQAFDAANQADAAAITQGDTSLYNANQAEIDSGVSRAVADAQGGYTRSMNQAIRQGLRYGASGAGITSAAGGLGLAQAQNVAATATGARTAGLSNVRQRLATGLQLRGSNMQALNGQQSLDWARKLDAAGLVKGLPGASAGAYGAAAAAGSTAVSAINGAGAMATRPGEQAMNGMAQGNSTIMQGQGMKINGLSNVMNAQAQNQDDGSGLGSILGGAAKIGGLFMMSDRRMKENIVRIGTTNHDLPLYEFNYIGDDTRYRGVMADEAEKVMPEAVVYDDIGFARVNYAMLGIEMEEV